MACRTSDPKKAHRMSGRPLTPLLSLLVRYTLMASCSGGEKHRDKHGRFDHAPTIGTLASAAALLHRSALLSPAQPSY